MEEVVQVEVMVQEAMEVMEALVGVEVSVEVKEEGG